ncbi:MAG TPA: hypothetical protein VKE41_02575 [Roseiflexaceae bacterium]|nr:hypothetical protein [Roseiflexaceae bacterium]
MTWLPTFLLATSFVLAVILTIVVGRRFKRYDLTTVATPSGIIDLELAGNGACACRIVNAWRATDVLKRAWPNLRLDMFWIPCYAAALALGCALFARVFDGWWAYLGAALAVGQVLAGLLDYVENIALLGTLADLQRRGAARAAGGFVDCDAPGADQPRDTPPKIAASCARMKFRLVSAGLVYIMLGVLFWVLT